MKLDRMFGITMELMTRNRVTAAELAARFEVSVRTIYRDIDLINQAGIPIVSYTGTDGGFELMDGFFLTRQHFSIDDFSVIYSLLKGLEAALGGSYTTLARKLTSLQPALKNGGDDRHNIILEWSTNDSEKTVVQQLLPAIRQNLRISFSYVTALGTETARTVEPLQLFWEQGAWYLKGFCQLRRANRLFRVSRISGLQVTEEKFTARHEKPEEEEKNRPQGMEVHLRFTPSARLRAMEQFPRGYVMRDGHLEVKTVCYTKDYALSIVLSYGTEVTILSPDSLKEDLLQKIKEIGSLYSNVGGMDE
ncbi:YafY family transcriptional regulator [Paenibacillus sp. alder61]|uniref:helix-turn-helix transcriptional regulator n=1 Tax=Paenibacillus sp. alder61 TaxID=2862948 RepID=UPI001CD7D878|nr:YafY family protein [Paenibacillus sp. alder61]MCA1295471.1 YafY family transcriptional regulator [Paenibacillus sp. alder61]